MFSPDDFKLSFSSVVAPKLTIPQLAELAKSSGYAGLELVITGAAGAAHAHGIELGATPAKLAGAKQALADNGIEVSCIATPLSFGIGAGAQVDDLKRYITLAESLGCKTVRVFGNDLSPEKGEIAGLVDAMVDSLADAVAYAEQSSVSIALETCGDFSTTKYAREVVKQVYSERFGVLWDIGGTYRALETNEEAYDNLSGKVKHVHVGDFRFADGQLKTQPIALGDGEVPFASAIAFLAHDGFEGYLSVETTLEPADDVLPQHAQVLHGLIGEAFPEPVETT